ncbi:MAG: hypothetical protein RLW68_04010 [Devosia marina]|jgi:hypothetical protein|uniref:hypothetical protein n=1 Tax=Devosia marina TaxID=2683198 RepID=UPI0032EE3593
MSTPTYTTGRPAPTLIYWLDAAGSLAFGIVLIALAAPLTSLLGWSLPDAVLTAIGFGLLPWAMFNLIIASSSRAVPRLVRANIAGDLLWIVGSVALILFHASELATLGWVALVAQALAVGVVMATKIWGECWLSGQLSANQSQSSWAR